LDPYYLSKEFWRILSIIINAFMIVSFITPINATSAFALDAPQPIYPIDFSDTTPVTDPPLGVPSYSWSGVSGATKYRLQVDNEIGFNTQIDVNITTKNTFYTPASTGYLLADGEWHWRVRVEEPAPVGEWSEIMTFTKSWATDENKPTLLTPDENASLAFFNARDFSWTPVIGAAKYRFQIASSPDGFSSPVLSDDTLTTTIQPEGRLENGEYWWRVIPMDTVDHLGTSSEIRNFTMAYGTYAMDLVPTLLEPKDETFPTFTPTFHWTAVEGAENYRLEYTSDETCDFSVGTSIETRQTSYTPVDTFPNDVRYCWHLRVESGSAVGDWSDTWHFKQRWYLQPHLLTPTNQYQNVLYPIYSWTPIPGASRYKIEIALNSSFNPIFETFTTANTSYAPQLKYYGTAHYYWRVTPIDGGGELGLTSTVADFHSHYNSTSPILVYPLYYYPPNDPIYYGDYSMNPVEYRTVAYPIFMWHRVMIPSPDGGVFATAYRIQVDTTPYFNNIVWKYDTENTSATPVDSYDFSPQVGEDYFWHVCVLDHIGGNCLEGAYSGWSQTWRAHFDPRLALSPTNGESPELLHPAIGQESVEATPLLEWWPYQEITQTQYIVEISRDSDFSSIEISETVNIPSYSPDYSLAQRSLSRTDYGTFFWRVRGYIGGAWSDWSDAWRFQIASQSEWRYIRTLGDPVNRLLIGEDPAGDTTETYDLNTLYATQQGGDPSAGIQPYWFLGFNANLTSPNMTYAFYIDLDHIDGSGAPTSPPFPRNYTVTTIPAHQPEFAIYVDKISGVVNAQNTWVYAWNVVEWGYGQRLSDIGGLVYATDGYVELQLLNGTIGMSQITSSASLMLFSVNTDIGVLEDSVPSDAEVPGNAQLSHFSAVSENMCLVTPPNSASGDPTTFPSILPFYWDWPTGSDPSTPFAGSKLEVHLDPSYTNLVAEFHINSTDSYFGENNVTFLDDIIGDNIYYWRVQPRYWISGYDSIYGAWTGGWSFRRLGFTVKNLNTSITWATPTFSWDMVEGANNYRLQVSTDPYFGSIVINQVTSMNSYTPSGSLTQGNYYWRVQIIRYNNIGNAWSDVMQFNLSLPTPFSLSPDQQVVHYAPTFCWDPLIKYNDEPPYEPILTAWKYRVQVSRDENFSTIYDSINTYNNCWTPTSGFHDGTYWWHVAMIDGNGKLGNYSPAATFTKQYPITTLISPIGGSVPGTPTFIWTPVDGAATYVFKVSKYSIFSPTYDSIETINTQYTPTKTYDSNILYYWRVAIQDRNSKQGPFTDATILIGVGNNTFLPLIKR
jgi:hypothetical protein